MRVSEGPKVQCRHPPGPGSLLAALLTRAASEAHTMQSAKYAKSSYVFQQQRQKAPAQERLLTPPEKACSYEHAHTPCANRWKRNRTSARETHLKLGTLLPQADLCPELHFLCLHRFFHALPDCGLYSLGHLLLLALPILQSLPPASSSPPA